MQKAEDSSTKVYQKVLLDKMKRFTGIESANLEECFGSNNYTVT